MQGITETDASAAPFAAVDRPTRAILDDALAGKAPSDAQAHHLLTLPQPQLPALFAAAAALARTHKGRVITYSPKVFLPITNLCLDRCSYCTFRKDPGDPGAWTMLPEDVRSCSARGHALGCIEALMCLGDRPERAHRSYRDTLRLLGHDDTISYVAACCEIALDEGLLPHTNAGLLRPDEMAMLRPRNASLGLMLESSSARLRGRGGAHASAPDKDPELRLQMMREAGELRIPFTTGILLGIGETTAERIDSLRAIADVHATYGHIQEIIVQNFRAKPNTRMAAEPEPESWETAAAVAVARLMMPEMNVQVPPNLNPHDLRLFLAAGINDWGGISPLTLDYVNPEAPWPQLEVLAAAGAESDLALRLRLPTYAEYLTPEFLDPAILDRIVARHVPQGAHHVEFVA